MSRNRDKLTSADNHIAVVDPLGHSFFNNFFSRIFIQDAEQTGGKKRKTFLFDFVTPNRNSNVSMVRPIPAVRLTCIACFCRFLSQFSDDFHEILYGLFASHSATTVKFSSENNV